MEEKGSQKVVLERRRGPGTKKVKTLAREKSIEVGSNWR